MIYYKCKECSYESITPTTFCPRCSKQSFEELSAPELGRVYSYTTIRVAPEAFSEYAPYQVALIQLTDELKVTAYISEKVNIDDKVKLKEIKNDAFIYEPLK